MSIVHREQISVEPYPVELIVARGMTARDLLGEQYTADPHGRPVVPGRSISISHTEDVLALAIRAHGRIGVDVEFHSDTARVWTAQEAVSKALGLGVSIDLSQIEICEDHPNMKFASLYGNPALAKGWTILHREIKIDGKVLMIAVAFD